MRNKRPPEEGAEQSAPADRLPYFLVDPEEFARIARSQREAIFRIAEKMEAGESLNELETALAAAVLRGGAAMIPDAQARKRGQAPKLDAANVAMHYAALIRQGKAKDKTEAIRMLAEGNEVTDEAMRKLIRKYGDAGLALYDSWTVRPKLTTE